MNQILEIGQEVISKNTGKVIAVEQFLGGGGQGEVYRVSLQGRPLALKWYFPEAITPAYRKNLERLIDKGPPNRNFLWPMEIVFDENLKSFGYLMPLRDERYKGIVDLMKRRIDPSFRALALAGFNLAHSFLQLHSKGMCYSDISFGNVFMHPESGDILICDNDNCIFDGEKAGIKGTPRFMAPEVVLGGNPNTQSDLFSLAVLLFYMFFLHHPLEGRREAEIKCFDLPAMKKLYGAEPLFIFDPANDANRPVPGLHDNALIYWPLYPNFLRGLFTRAFTTGISDPQNGRVRETEWRAAMLRLRDCIIYCPACGAENFCDPGQGGEEDYASADPGAQPGRDSGGTEAGRSQAGVSCWSCRREVPLPPRLKLPSRPVMLNYDTKLYPHHIDQSAGFDFNHPLAEVNRHPEKPQIWGLKNTGSEKWVCTTVDGAVKDVPPGKSITLAVGTKINFGKSEGLIEK